MKYSFRVILFVFFIPIVWSVSGGFTAAQGQGLQSKSSLAFQSCEEERIHFCKDQTDFSGIEKCLIDHDADLSKLCKQEIQRILQFRKQSALRGGGALSSFGGLNAMGPPIPIASYDGRYSPGDSVSFLENRANLSAPVYKTEKDSLALSVAGGDFHFGNTLTLDTGTQIAEDLYRIEVGAQYAHQLSGKKAWGLRSSIGYAGDKPFNNARDITYGLSGNYGFPSSDKSYWILSIFMSNNNPLVNYIPIPGFAYIYRTATFTGMFGFPILSIQWTPTFPWSYSLAVFGPTVQSELGYGSLDHFQVFSGFYWTRQQYLPSDRPTAKDRLTIEEIKAGIGFRTPIWAMAIGEFQMGRAFGRSLFIGSGLTDKSGGSLGVEGDWYATWSVKARL